MKSIPEHTEARASRGRKINRDEQRVMQTLILTLDSYA